MKKKVLITIKTYPTLSTKYSELVCTAGITEDGKWIRIYPIPFRKLEYEKRYKKYQWMELELVRNNKDPRPESFRPINWDATELGVVIGTDKGSWSTRKKYVLKKVYTNLGQLISEAKDRNICTSLAVFKPSKIKDFIITETDREWDPVKLAQLNQINLFEDSENPFQVVNKLPYEFKYVFEDDFGTESKMMIEDWEIGQLYWNCLKRHNGDEGKACEDVRKKCWDDFVLMKDLYFYLGTTRAYHFVAPNPFLIVGVFYPKRTD